MNVSHQTEMDQYCKFASKTNVLKYLVVSRAFVTLSIDATKTATSLESLDTPLTRTIDPFFLATLLAD